MNSHPPPESADNRDPAVPEPMASDPAVPDLASVLEGVGMGNLGQLFERVQQQTLEAQAALAEQVVEGQAGGGVVKVTVTGDLDFRSVTIDPGAVDPGDIAMLEDLVLAAVRDAVGKVNLLSQQAIGGLGGLDGLVP